MGCSMKISWGRPHVRPLQPLFKLDEATGTCDINKELPCVRCGCFDVLRVALGLGQSCIPGPIS